MYVRAWSILQAFRRPLEYSGDPTASFLRRHPNDLSIGFLIRVHPSCPPWPSPTGGNSGVSFHTSKRLVPVFLTSLASFPPFGLSSKPTHSRPATFSSVGLSTLPWGN